MTSEAVRQIATPTSGSADDAADLFRDAAARANGIGPAQGTTAALNGMVRQFRSDGCHLDVGGGNNR